VAAAPVPPVAPPVVERRRAAPAPPRTPPADPLGDEAVIAAHRVLTGSAPPAEGRADGADWVGLAHSIEDAKDNWHALILGGLTGDVILAGALAARRRGLTPVLHASEADPQRFAGILSRLQDASLADGSTQLLQAAVSADPSRLPPRGALAQDLIGRAPAWDYVRIGLRGTIGNLLNRDTPLLTERVRWLVLATSGRAEEATALRLLDRSGWRLAAERPAAIAVEAPHRALRLGIQIWRGPRA
jgi:hypothetical protein